MKTLWRNNGLSLVLFGLFVMLLSGQSVVGWHEHNNERKEDHLPAISYSDYLHSGSFVEVTMENWESEFLQMFAYILFTAFLYQKGSAESKSPDEPAEVDRDPRTASSHANTPWPVRRGGWILTVYENSLGLAFLLLFIMSFGLHAWGGERATNVERLAHGEVPWTLLDYMSSSRFWFESLQNWQSEFLAIFSMVVFSIFLRQRGSPESKPVDSPHASTGD